MQVYVMLSINIRIAHPCATWQQKLYFSKIFYFFILGLRCFLQYLCVSGQTPSFIHLTVEDFSLNASLQQICFFWWKQFWVVIMLESPGQGRWAPPLPLADTNLHLLHCLVNQMLLSHRRSQTLIPCPLSSLLFSSFWPSVNRRGRDVTA